MDAERPSVLLEIHSSSHSWVLVLGAAQATQEASVVAA